MKYYLVLEMIDNTELVTQVYDSEVEEEELYELIDTWYSQGYCPIIDKQKSEEWIVPWSSVTRFEYKEISNG